MLKIYFYTINEQEYNSLLAFVGCTLYYLGQRFAPQSEFHYGRENIILQS